MSYERYEHIPGIFHQDPKAFQAKITQALENQAFLQRTLSQILIPGEDYHIFPIRGKDKYSLGKSGAQKIAALLGVRAEFDGASSYRGQLLLGKPVGEVVITCRLIDPTGSAVSEGVGARLLKTDKGDLNKCLKMAEKSAFIDAVIRLAAMSSDYTQDLEEMALASIEKSDKPGKPNIPYTEIVGDEHLTEQQVWAFKERFRSISDPKLKEIVGDMAASWLEINGITKHSFSTMSPTLFEQFIELFPGWLERAEEILEGKP